MHVALAHARGRHANELGIALQRLDVGAPAIAHPGAQTANQLVDHRRHAALVRHTTLDAFRHQLLRAVTAFDIELVLEVPIAAAAAHGAKRAHAAVFLEAAALIENDLA